LFTRNPGCPRGRGKERVHSVFAAVFDRHTVLPTVFLIARPNKGSTQTRHWPGLSFRLSERPVTGSALMSGTQLSTGGVGRGSSGAGFPSPRLRFRFDFFTWQPVISQGAWRSPSECPSELYHEQFVLRDEAKLSRGEYRLLPAAIPDDEQIVAGPNRPTKPRVAPHVLASASPRRQRKTHYFNRYGPPAARSRLPLISTSDFRVLQEQLGPLVHARRVGRYRAGQAREWMMIYATHLSFRSRGSECCWGRWESPSREIVDYLAREIIDRHVGA
jgi:hypothetical protein